MEQNRKKYWLPTAGVQKTGMQLLVQRNIFFRELDSNYGSG